MTRGALSTGWSKDRQLCTFPVPQRSKYTRSSVNFFVVAMLCNDEMPQFLCARYDFIWFYFVPGCLPHKEKQFNLYL